MNIIFIAVTSVDGKMTKGVNPLVHEWTSSEDAKHFLNTRNEHNLIVMGSKTYDVVKPLAEKSRLRIILTRNPDNYAQEKVVGQIEFSSESVTALVKRMEKLGYQKMLLVAGQKVATDFFLANLVNEFWLTIEPKLFGMGNSLLTQEMEIDLELFSLEKLNEKGTLLLKYRVKKR